MEDIAILELYWQRDEQAITQTKHKYGNMIRTLAYRILHNREDAEECENDTYLGAWNAIPPERPHSLSAFLSRLVRNISISRHRANVADKRGGGEVTLSLQELDECIPAQDVAWDERQLAEALDRFLDTLAREERLMFVCRYWRCDPVAVIAANMRCTQSKVKMTLLRTRGKLRTFLEKEGISYD